MLRSKGIIAQDKSRREATRIQKQVEAVGVPCIDVENKRVVVRFGKKVSGTDIVAYASRLRRDARFQPAFAEIVDLTAAEELDLGADEFLKLADDIDPFSQEAKRAFVARSAVQRHAARMHKILRSTRSIEIFPTFDEAVRWIESN